MVAMRFVPQALLGLLAFAVRFGGTHGLQSLWKVVGAVVTLGGSSMTERARAYTESRRKSREEAKKEAEKNAKTSGYTSRRTRRM